MRLGAPVYGWTDAESWAMKSVELGYGATYFPLNHKDDPEQIEIYTAAAKKHGLVIAEVGAWNNLLVADPAEREANLRWNVEQLKLADRIGARCCVNISGSLSSRWDGPHPDNLTEENYRRVVSNIQQIIDEAQPKNTYYTLEPMPWMFPHNAEDMRRLLKDVNRDAFAVHVDMCNMVNSFELVYNTGKMVREFFSEFGPHIRVVHAKDTIIGEGLTMRINEAIPGDGVFDYTALFEECAKLDPDLPVMAEHLDTEEQYARAMSFMKGRLKEMNIETVKGY